MAMYYQGSSEIQADGLQTLYLMNPNYAGYSDPPQPNMLFLNPATATAAMPQAPPLPQSQQFVGIPFSHDPSRPSPVQNQDTVVQRFHYNIWGLADQTINENQTHMAQQQTPRGLSLSLSAHQTPINQDFPAIGMISPRNCSPPSVTAAAAAAAAADQSNGASTVLIGSKYLKAAQELLDDVANVGKETRPESSKDKAKIIKDSSLANNVSVREGESGTELTTAQRQEIQMKKAKLNSMLDEVEQRYRQYHSQMQIVVASFEQAAGIGSARTYTQLALKTILKQFKCLKSTISAQIKELNKSLGEEDSPEKKLEGSRLRFVDQQLRLQQMGMMQNNAWRPQRGLPERAVSVLRAWLFEHFLHPYPKDSDKQMLAKQTGLTRSQVSNWFINARVRLWKPMVEEMYQEETKNRQQITTELDNSSTKAAGPEKSDQINTENLLESKKPRNAVHDSSPSSILSAEMEMKFSGDHGHTTTTENYLPMAAANMNRYGIGDHQLAATGFGQGNSFSLSLGLPPAETSHHHSFLSHRNLIEPEGGRINHPGNIGYEILDFQNRKSFPAQLLPDFVA